MRKVEIATTADFLSTIRAERTNTYTAISHKDVINKTRDLLAKNNIPIIQEDYTQCSNGKIAQGNYILGFQNSDFSLQLVWQNSTNKEVSFKYCVGNRVFVCANGAIFGDLGAFRRIHKGTADIEAFQTMEQYIERLEESFEEQVILYDKMKNIEITQKTCAELIGRMFIDEEILTITQLGIINRELKEPSFSYGVEDTLYNLYQHCTHSFKGITPRTWLPKQMELSSFLVNEFSL